jgi:sulfopyruvate decarboxylase TPP-binding subunit
LQVDHKRIQNPQEHKENAFVCVISVNLSFPILTSAPKASELYYLYSIPAQLLLGRLVPKVLPLAQILKYVNDGPEMMQFMIETTS